MCIHEFVCVCLFILKHCMKINNGSKMCSPLSSFTLLNNTHQIAQFHLPQFSRKSCPWKIISVCVCVCVCVVYIFVHNSSYICAWQGSGPLKGRCERPTVCQSAYCWECAGPAGARGAWGRGRSHLGDGGWSVTARHGSDPPVAAPQPACRRCQNGLRSTENACVSGWYIFGSLTKCH